MQKHTRNVSNIPLGARPGSVQSTERDDQQLGQVSTGRKWETHDILNRHRGIVR